MTRDIPNGSGPPENPLFRSTNTRGAYLCFHGYIMSESLYEEEPEPGKKHESGDEYRVIARRYRPSTFDEVIGQEHVTRTLKNSIREDRLGHAYLFSGPRGIGKTSTARILARAVNCEKGMSPNPCNECDVCRELEVGSTPDIIEIDAASQRGIDDIRNLRETVRYSPLSCDFRVYIIDEAHMLSRDAFNAFLKTLEEPPDHVLFVFATTEPEKMPDTIRSRCQQFSFRRIPQTLIRDRLQDIAKTEGIDISDKLLSRVARAGDGALRDAQSLLDQLISVSEGSITENDLQMVLGTVNEDVLRNLLDALSSGDSGRVLEAIHTVYSGGGKIDVFVQQFLDRLRNLLIIQKCGPDTVLIERDQEELQELKQEAVRFNSKDISRLIDKITGVRARSANLFENRLTLEASLVAFAEQIESTDREREEKSSGNTEDSSPDRTKETENRTPEENREQTPTDEGKEETSTANQVSDSGQAATEEETEQVEVEGAISEPRTWKQFRNILRQKHPDTDDLLEPGSPDQQDDKLIITFDPEDQFFVKQLERGDHKDIIEKCLAGVFDVDRTIQFETRREPSSETPEESESETRSDADQPPAAEDPNVQKTRDLFDADIIDVEENP